MNAAVRSCSAIRMIAILALIVTPRLAHADISENSRECELLKQADFSRVQDAPAQITVAEVVRAKDGVPAHCKIVGYVSPQVGFDLRLPLTRWNGKFLMVGCGGMCGVLVTEDGVCDDPLQRGYACVVSDLGHKGAGALWAYNNLQAQIDIGYRATHVVALAGKQITQEYYGAPPRKAYHSGCSAGGRAGLVSAQRFPRDFDGIIVGAPTIDVAAFFAAQLHVVQMMKGKGGASLLSASDLRLLHDSVLDTCDLDDGVRDGVVGNPPACKFDPEALACASGNDRAPPCLQSSQVQVAKALYGGLIAHDGERLHPGWSAGSELRWAGLTSDSWIRYITDAFRYVLLVPDPGPEWDLAKFDVLRDYGRLETIEALYSAANPDLHRFKAAGGKIIMFHGWNDVSALPARTVEYYETVERTMGGRPQTQDFLRLFMMPGTNHCTGGDGADAADFLTHLEAWVESGEAPEKILAAHVPDGRGRYYPYRSLTPTDAARATFTRPLYAYPLRAVYSGTGDKNHAANLLPFSK